MPGLKKSDIHLLGLKGFNGISGCTETEELFSGIKSTHALFIKAGAVLMSENWENLGLADSEINGVACVFPVLIDNNMNILSAGIGVGYGEGLMDMLKGSSFEDQHYTRGLYAKSRRNVTLYRINTRF